MKQILDPRRKIPFACVCLSLYLFSANASSAENESEYKLTGDVTRVEERKYDLEYTEKFGEGEWREVPAEDSNTNTVYTSFHKVLSIEELDEEGYTTSFHLRKYDEKGNQVELNDYDSEGALVEKAVMGRKDLSDSAKLSLYNWNTVSRYNDQGDLIEKVIYKHNARSFLETMEAYAPNGELTHTFILKWDTNGNRIEQSRRNANGGLVWLTASEFDTDGNEIKQMSYDENNVVEDGFAQKFNERLQVIERLYYGENSKVEARWRHEYTYDKVGNYISRTISKQVEKFGKNVFEPRHVAYRTITYAGESVPEPVGPGQIDLANPNGRSD
jgi:YD repeat-containing protein